MHVSSAVLAPTFSVNAAVFSGSNAAQYYSANGLANLGPTFPTNLDGVSVDFDDYNKFLSNGMLYFCKHEDDGVGVDPCKRWNIETGIWSNAPGSILITRRKTFRS